jgi:hypothetical protein
MIVNYRPDGQESQTWNFQPSKVRESRIEMIERRLGKLVGEKGGVPFDQFQAELMQGSASARRVLLWHLLSQTHPTLRIEDVDPLREELDVQATKQELAVYRDAYVSIAGEDDPQREMVLADLDRRIAGAPDDVDGGKALPLNSESVTG